MKKHHISVKILYKPRSHGSHVVNRGTMKDGAKGFAVCIFCRIVKKTKL